MTDTQHSPIVSNGLREITVTFNAYEFRAIIRLCSDDGHQTIGQMTSKAYAMYAWYLSAVEAGSELWVHEPNGATERVTFKPQLEPSAQGSSVIPLQLTEKGWQAAEATRLKGKHETFDLMTREAYRFYAFYLTEKQNGKKVLIKPKDGPPEEISLVPTEPIQSNFLL